MEMFIFIEIISLLTLDYGAWIKNCISETFCDAVGNKIHCQSSEQNSLMSVMTEKVPSVPLNLTPSRTVISILFLTPFNSTVINSLLFLFSLNNPAAESLAVEGEGQARDVIGVCSLRTEWDTRDGTQRPHGGLSLSTLTARNNLLRSPSLLVWAQHGLSILCRGLVQILLFSKGPVTK